MNTISVGMWEIEITKSNAHYRVVSFDEKQQPRWTQWYRATPASLLDFTVDDLTTRTLKLAAGAAADCVRRLEFEKLTANPIKLSGDVTSPGFVLGSSR